MEALLHDPASLKTRIRQITGGHLLREAVFPTHIREVKDASAVMFLLGLIPGDDGHAPEPGLILNKRSRSVAQPGDLCCPGGGISPGMDMFLSGAMTLPGLPMWRWAFWQAMRSRRPKEAKMLRMLFFTSLRECFEEMRLNPFGVRFLGPLPLQRLVMFGRVIYPMAGWISRQQRFRLNGEVEKVVTIPLRKLLDPANYVQYRLEIKDSLADNGRRQVYDAPSYLHRNGEETEVLWGATCRITLTFLDLIFGFALPADGSLPVLGAALDQTYLHPDAVSQA